MALISAAVLSAVALIILTGKVLLLIFAGLLLAVLLSSAADGLASISGIPRGVALGLTLILLTVTFAAIGFALWPSVSRQIDQLSTQLPEAIDKLRHWVQGHEWGRRLLANGNVQGVVTNGRVIGQATGALTTAMSFLVGSILIVFIGVYVAAQPNLYKGGIRRLIPKNGRAAFDSVLHEVTSVLRWWLLGKLLSMSLVGLLTTVGLWWLHVPLALTFGLLAAALTFIPNLGPILSVVPPAILALSDDPLKAAYVVLLYLAIQTVESYAITPLIQRRTVSMPPALTITSQVVLGLLAGAVGVAVATPLAATAMVMTRMLYVEHVLESGAGGPDKGIPNK